MLTSTLKYVTRGTYDDFSPESVRGEDGNIHTIAGRKMSDPMTEELLAVQLQTEKKLYNTRNRMQWRRKYNSFTNQSNKIRFFNPLQI